MFVELHILQSFAPSNLNRDDTGSPKDCEFGGVRRARISSQCLKRAIRTNPAFAAATGVPVADRTRRVTRALLQRLAEKGIREEDAVPVVNEFVRLWTDKDAKPATVDDHGVTSAQFYVSQGELDDAAEAIGAQFDVLSGDSKAADKARGQIVKDLAKAYGDRTTAPDVALFGRMMASRPELGLDAACQVAHAISTHKVAMEMDFYTAVDDLLERDEPGAGMMGVTGYNSACYYRYARVDWEQLLKNLDGDVELALRAIEGFVQASVEAVPSGKQNSHAAYNPPSLVGVVVRRSGMAWNLANAFEQPVRARGDSGYVVPSAAALDTYYGKLLNAYTGGSVAGAAWQRVLPEDLELPHLDAFPAAGMESLTGLVRFIVQEGV